VRPTDDAQLSHENREYVIYETIEEYPVPYYPLGEENRNVTPDDRFEAWKLPRGNKSARGAFSSLIFLVGNSNLPLVCTWSTCRVNAGGLKEEGEEEGGDGGRGTGDLPPNSAAMEP